MADIQVANTDADLSGNTVVTEENTYTITGLHTFSRSTNAPFACISGSAYVQYLDADKLDGQEGAYYLAAGNITGTLAVNQGGTGAATFTDGGVLLGSGTSAITATAVLGDGVILIGDASGDPTTLDVGSSTAITILGTIATGVWNGTAVTVTYGGTGASSLTDGGVLLGSGTGAVTAMAVLADSEMIVGNGSTDPVAESGSTLRTSIGCDSASNITSGTLANARLPSNVDLGGTLDVTGATTLDSTLGVVGAVTFNDAGGDVDFRVESSSQSHMLFVDGGTDQVGVEISSFTSTGGAGTKLEVGGSIVVKKDQGHLFVYSNDYIIGKIGNAGSGAALDTGYFSLSRGDGTEIIKLNAGDGVDSEINKDSDICMYIGKGFISSSGTNMTGDRAHFGHVDCENGTDYAVVQTADGNTTVNCKTSQRIWFGINAGAIGNWDATGLRIGDATAASYKLDVNGSLNKTSGTFSIDHPLPSMTDTHKLVHSFIEGPKADLIYRGTVTLVDGTAEVDLDEAAGMTSGTWVLLCRDEQVFTSNETGWFHVRGSVTGSTLTIDCEESTCTDTVSWMVVACRKDQHMYDTEWTNEDGYPIVEPLKVAPDPDPPL